MATRGIDKGRASRGTDGEGLSDELIDVLCSVCKRKGKNKEAEKYCVDCNNYFCLPCLKVHDDFLSLSGHKVLDKKDFHVKSNQAELVVPTERCDRHGRKLVDMYCEDHDDVGCATCIAVDHRACRDAFYIPEYIKEKVNAETSTEMDDKLGATDNDLSEYLDGMILERKRLVDKQNKALDEMKIFRKKIDKRLDELEHTTTGDIKKKFEALINGIEERMRLLQTCKATVQSAKDRINSADNNVSQEFVNVIRGQNSVKEAEKCMDERIAVGQEQDIKVVPNQEIYTSLCSFDVFGSVTQKVRLLQVKNKIKYSVKVASDKADCGIVSVCALDDGRLVLSDYHNKKLKCVETSTFTVTDYVDLPGTPWQVCQIGKGEVAVSLQLNRQVQFVSLEGKMKKTRVVETDYFCYALAYAANRLYVASNTGEVYIYDVTGRKQRLFNKDEYGQPLFYEIYSLAVTKDSSQIVVADWNRGLIVLNHDGQVVWKFNGPQLGNAYGCFLTKTRSVLVCGRSSNNVLQFGPDGKFIGEVLRSDGGNKGCQTVCFNRKMSKMIISKEQNELEVYDLC